MNGWLLELNVALKELEKVRDGITREARRKWLEKLRQQILCLRDGIV